MNLLSWSVNAIDRIFSTRPVGTGEHHCPDGTFLAGYMLDSWDTFKTMCLAPLDVEDVGDVYIFTTMTIGITALGFGVFMLHRKLRKMGLQQTKAQEDTDRAAEATARVYKEAMAIMLNEAIARMSDRHEESDARLKEDITQKLEKWGKRWDVKARNRDAEASD